MLKAGDKFILEVNKVQRDAVILAVVGNNVLIEYEAASATGLRIVKAGWFDEATVEMPGNWYRNTSYTSVPTAYLEEMVVWNMPWIGNPQVQLAPVDVPSPQDLLAERLGDHTEMPEIEIMRVESWINDEGAMVMNEKYYVENPSLDNNKQSILEYKLTIGDESKATKRYIVASDALRMAKDEFSMSTSVISHGYSRLSTGHLGKFLTAQLKSVRRRLGEHRLSLDIFFVDAENIASARNVFNGIREFQIDPCGKIIRIGDVGAWDSVIGNVTGYTQRGIVINSDIVLPKAYFVESDSYGNAISAAAIGANIWAIKEWCVDGHKMDVFLFGVIKKTHGSFALLDISSYQAVVVGIKTVWVHSSRLLSKSPTVYNVGQRVIFLPDGYGSMGVVEEIIEFGDVNIVKTVRMNDGREIKYPEIKELTKI